MTNGDKGQPMAIFKKNPPLQRTWRTGWTKQTHKTERKKHAGAAGMKGGGGEKASKTNMQVVALARFALASPQPGGTLALTERNPPTGMLMGGWLGRVGKQTTG